MAKEELGGKNGTDAAKPTTGSTPATVSGSGANSINGSNNGDPNISNEIPTKVTAVVVSTLGSLPESQKSVVLNVGGQRYETLKRNFANFPNSRLYRLVHATSPEEILRYCDRFKPGFENGCAGDYVPAEYFFDRNWTGFAAILDTYRTGNLHLNSNICAVMTRDDMEYWGIDILLVEPCCAVKYYPEIEICVKELEMEEREKQSEIEREKIEDFGPTLPGRIRKYLWNLFEYPSTSRGAQVSYFPHLKSFLCFSYVLFPFVSSICFPLIAHSHQTFYKLSRVLRIEPGAAG